MVDASESWDELFTVQPTSPPQGAENDSIGAYFPYRELARRVEARLRRVLQHSPRGPLPKLEASDRECELPTSLNPPSSKPLSLSWRDVILLMALLRRAIVMQRQLSSEAPSVEEEIFQRETDNARRDMSALTLPSLSPPRLTL